MPKMVAFSYQEPDGGSMSLRAAIHKDLIKAAPAAAIAAQSLRAAAASRIVRGRPRR
jgi:hypothetical protein